MKNNNSYNLYYKNYKNNLTNYNKYLLKAYKIKIK